MKQGRWSRARELVGQAIRAQREALTTVPENAYYLKLLNKHLSDLLILEVRSNQSAQAALTTAREWSSLAKGDPVSLYNIARAIAACSALATGETGQTLAEEAVVTLRAAVAAGWDDATRTCREHDLASLRRRDDFLMIIAEMFDRLMPTDPFIR
jgi:hypothetical protein